MALKKSSHFPKLSPSTATLSTSTVTPNLQTPPLRPFSKKIPTAINEELRSIVVDKATQFFYRYRPLNTFYYTGARNKSYGYLDFLPAMRNFDLMVANRDKAIHTTASTGKTTKPDDSNLTKMDDVLLSRGANKFLSVADELKAFKVDPRFEVNCFASEEDFPEMACPIQNALGRPRTPLGFHLRDLSARLPRAEALR